MQFCGWEEGALVFISNDYIEGCERVEQCVDTSMVNPQNEPSKCSREIYKKILIYGRIGGNL